jgi:hypothetical protein
MYKVHRQVKHREAKGKQDEEFSYSPAARDKSASLQATCMHVDDPKVFP